MTIYEKEIKRKLPELCGIMIDHVEASSKKAKGIYRVGKVLDACIRPECTCKRVLERNDKEFVCLKEKGNIHYYDKILF